MAIQNSIKATLIMLAVAGSAAACSKSNTTQDNVTSIETVDPMTNATNDTLGNQYDTLNPSNMSGNASDMSGNSSSTTTGSMPTDATNTLSGTSSSGPSDTRGTRGETPPR